MLNEEQKRDLEFQARIHKNSYGLECAMRLLQDELDNICQEKEQDGRK